MKVLSWNVNGIRSVFKHGFLEWLKKSNADIICLQEVRAQTNQFPKELTSLKNYNLYLNPAVKKGYSGTAIFSKEKPLRIETKLGLKRFDDEGRFIGLDYPDFTFIDIYLPHGGRMKENLNYKLEVYEYLLNYLDKIKDKNVIIAGDFNIAHQEIDLARPKANKNNIMFTLEERKQIDSIIELGFIDTFRKFHKDGSNYTWWPYMVNARERNLGWRIDYVFISKPLLNKLKKSFILNNDRGSDHCPIGIEID